MGNEMARNSVLKELACVGTQGVSELRQMLCHPDEAASLNMDTVVSY
jgi:hypothetical protein